MAEVILLGVLAFLYVNYLCYCDVCGLSFKFQHSESIWPDRTQEGQRGD